MDQGSLCSKFRLPYIQTIGLPSLRLVEVNIFGMERYLLCLDWDCIYVWPRMGQFYTRPLSFPLKYIHSNQPLDYILFLYSPCLQNLTIIKINLKKSITISSMFLLEQKPLSFFTLCWGYTNKICKYYKER